MIDIVTFLSDAALQKSVIAAGLFIVASVVYLWWRRKYWASLPSYNEIPGSVLKKIASKKVLAELSGKVDVCIVGSGIGALASASLLSKCGYKVVIFEQHYTVGGSTHMYSDGGFEFDVGVHYVGGQMDRWASPFRMVFNVRSVVL